MQGWRTWNNNSVLSHVHMPDGLGIQLGIKEYPRARMLTHVLIGEKEENGAILPRAHTYDGTYTELELSWGDNELIIQTAVEEDDLVILVTPVKQPAIKESILFINGVVLWNREGVVQRKGDVLLLKNEEREIPVYMTAPHTGQFFVNYTSQYLSADLSEKIGISTGKQRTVEEIQKILDCRKEAWHQNKDRWGDLAECYNAMQTCQAWDTIYNPEGDVPITTVSRIWNNNWGGYVLFCWDTYFGSLMQSFDEKELAYCNAIEITNTLTPAGFIPNYCCHNGIKSCDRSQPPVGSMVRLMIYERYKEKWFLEEVYENLLTWNRWFAEHRFTENGLLTWGSDPYEAKFGYELEVAGINEWQGAAWESGLDNSPMAIL